MKFLSDEFVMKHADRIFAGCMFAVLGASATAYFLATKFA